MKYNPEYPLDFKQALERTFSDEEVTHLLSKSSCSPRFVYGTLMLPTVLKYYIDLHQNTAVDMMLATLPGYKLYWLSNNGLPAMVPSSDPLSAVEGMLIFGLNEQQRNAIYEFEGGLTRLVDVRVKVRQIDPLDIQHEVKSSRAVDAGAFAWKGSRDGLVALETAYWPVDDFLDSAFYRGIELSQRRNSLDSNLAGG